MEQSNQSPTQPDDNDAAVEGQRPWVKPVVMSIPLNEATNSGDFTDILDGAIVRSGS